MFYFNFDIDSSERYDPSKFMKVEEGLLDIIDSYFIQELIKLKPVGAYIVKNQENRPDIVAYKIYGNVNYWWIILLFNNLIDHKLYIGQVINYPSIESIENLYFKLKALGLEV